MVTWRYDGEAICASWPDPSGEFECYMVRVGFPFEDLTLYEVVSEMSRTVKRHTKQ